jgi:acyl-CoA reductase-like NAD-dependent aldehyde dehydrogenase
VSFIIIFQIDLYLFSQKEIDNVCAVSREEIFGPVTSVIRFSKFEDAIKMANDTGIQDFFYIFY